VVIQLDADAAGKTAAAVDPEEKPPSVKRRPRVPPGDYRGP
jgi:hypothetical protein